MSHRLHHRILLTGAAGALGSDLRPRLHANCEVLRLSDIAALGQPQDGEEVVIADLADAQAVSAMVKDCNAIVHLGGCSTEGPFAPILAANILGMHNLYEAARRHATRRIVFASSNHVTGFYRQSETVRPDMPARPDSNYGLSKAFGEDIARFYHDRYGIETACLRIGSCFPQPRDRRMLASWLSYDDLYRLVSACLSTPVLGHSIIYGVSNNPVTWWDNSSANHIGYTPVDSSEGFRDAMFASTKQPDLNDPVVQFQGGSFVAMGPYEN